MPRLADQESGCAGFGGTPGPEERLVITDRLHLGWEAFFAGDINGPPTFPKRGNNPRARRLVNGMVASCLPSP